MRRRPVPGGVDLPVAGGARRSETRIAASVLAPAVRRAPRTESSIGPRSAGALSGPLSASARPTATALAARHACGGGTRVPEALKGAMLPDERVQPPGIGPAFPHGHRALRDGRDREDRGGHGARRRARRGVGDHDPHAVGSVRREARRRHGHRHHPQHRSDAEGVDGPIRPNRGQPGGRCRDRTARRGRRTARAGRRRRTARPGASPGRGGDRRSVRPA